MKLITCASYYGTGSSAVTDLINECDNVHFMGDYEFRFVQDPDGICDLEYNLVLNNHRHNSGYAIKRYERNVDFLSGNRFIKKYNKFFGDQWRILSKEYINELVDLEYKGYWHQDVRDKGNAVYFIERAINKMMHSLPFVDPERNYSVFMNNFTNYVSYPGERFYYITRRYIDRLFESCNYDHKEFVMADQLVPPSNTSHYLRFFNDLKVVCVERDPRDLYILEKKYWNGTIIPHEIDQFCKWYKITRLHRDYENDDCDRILRIDFEDLIYKYDETTSKVMSFCGIEPFHHTSPKTLLIPEKSINNTKLFEKHKEFESDIKIIERELNKYLYSF